MQGRDAMDLLQEHADVVAKAIADGLHDQVNAAADLVIAALSSGGKLITCGNGGSAADAQHIAAELTGRFERERRPLGAIALTTNTSGLTAIANDYGYKEVFVRPLQGLGRPGDVLLGLSTSGNSENVLRALRWARQNGIRTIGLSGAGGRRMAGLCDVAIQVPSHNVARIQELHIFIGHALCALVEQTMFPEAVDAHAPNIRPK